jgi:toxin ParE1/3/4
MKPSLRRHDDFNSDFDRQYRWYLEQAGEIVAERFLKAVLITLGALVDQPESGRRRNFRQQALQDLRSFRVEPPFQKTLIFYRVTNDALEVWRLMHGARDLPRRLAEPPPSAD